MMPMTGMALKSPSRLCNCIRAMYYQLVDIFHEQTGETLLLIETMRDVERQRYYMSIGASRTMNSKHLPQPPFNKSLAFDVCPTEYLKLKQWNPNGMLWQALGRIGTGMGLEWGGDWQSWPDQPHFQLEKCQCGSRT